MRVWRKSWKITTVLLGLAIAVLAIVTPLSPPGPTQRILAAVRAIVSLGFICWLLFLFATLKKR